MYLPEIPDMSSPSGLTMRLLPSDFKEVLLALSSEETPVPHCNPEFPSPPSPPRCVFRRLSILSRPRPAIAFNHKGSTFYFSPSALPSPSFVGSFEVFPLFRVPISDFWPRTLPPSLYGFFFRLARFSAQPSTVFDSPTSRPTPSGVLCFPPLKSLSLGRGFCPRFLTTPQCYR